MRHRRKGRKLGRNPNHQRALLRNLASALILTTRDGEFERELAAKDPTLPKPPKVKGRIITTLQKAKEVRPLVERCVTLARNALPALQAADKLEPASERGSDAWRSWRASEQYAEWNKTIAPVVAARRKALQLLGDKQAVRLLFDEVAPQFADRPGGYTRVLKLAAPRLGDAGARAILEFVGKNDRVRKAAGPRPSFESDESASVAAE